MLLGWLIFTGMYILRATNEYYKDNELDEKSDYFLVNAVATGLIFLSGLLFSRLTGDPTFGADFDYFRFDESVLEKPKLGVEDRSGWLSRLTFWWMNGLFRIGYRKQIDFEDTLPYFSPTYDAKRKYQQMRRAWDAQPENKKSVLFACFTGFGWAYMCNGFLKIAYDISQFMNPIILKKFLDFMAKDDADASEGITLSLILLGSGFVGTLILQRYWHVGFRFGMDCRSALACALFEKTLVMSPTERQNRESGKIMNLVTTDCKKIRDLFPYWWMLISAPFQVIICSYLLYGELGYSIFIGMGFTMLTIMPLNYLFAARVKAAQTRRLAVKDERLSIMNEILGAMKVLKLYAWEPIFEKKVKVCREEEVGHLRTIIFWRSLSSFCWNTIPIFVMAISLVWYIYVAGGTITPSRAFTTIVLINMLRFPLAILPMMLVWFAEALASLERIQEYLEAAEIPADREMLPIEDPETVIQMGTPQGDPTKFYWDDKHGKIALQGLNFNTRRGSLTMVVGKIGAGKSALLKSLIGELTKSPGDMFTMEDCSMAYSSQLPWIQNMTLRKNILFGSGYEVDWYKEVVRACALIPDFNQLTDADRTEIGEKGINLSGGQKQRVALARAVYANADLYLLDDPLSAVDVHVASHLMNECIMKMLHGNGKTVILCTNAVKYLPNADRIIVLEDGKMLYDSTYGRLREKGVDFEKYTVTEDERKEKDGGKSETSSVVNSPKSTSPPPSTGWEDASVRMVEEPRTPEAIATEDVKDQRIWDAHREVDLLHPDSDSDNGKLALSLQNGPDRAGAAGQLVKAEKREKGRVGKQIYKDYLQAIGGCSIFGPYCFAYILVSCCQIGADRFMGFWSDASQDQEKLYLWIYVSISLCPILLQVVVIILKAIWMLTSAKALHHRCLESVLLAPMSFF